MLRLQDLTLLVPVITIVSSQYDYVSECPEENGFFADALQCDRYYECNDGEVSEHFCPDGLVFDEQSTSYAKCGFPFSIDCTGREDLQPAKPSPGCPRQEGYFSHPDEKVCNMFNFCTRGVPNSITCAGGLIFDPLKGQCDYSDQVDRPGCTSDDLFSFQCPESTSAHEHSRYSDPDDCSKFYLCVIGKARSQTCSQGLVFNPDTLSCEEQDTVTGPCSAFYNQTFLESLSTPPPALSPSITAGRVISQEGRRRPSRPQSVSRRPVGNFLPQPQQELPQEQIPQQLLDLQDFGQTDDFSSVRGGPPPRGRVPVGRPGPEASIRGQEKEAFLTSLRTSIRQRERTPDRGQTTAAPRQFTRPPRRRPSDPSSQAQDTGFGRRRRPGARPRPATAEPSPVDLLAEVEAELARREQTQEASLGPADLDSLLSQSQGRGSGSRRRLPGSRGGPQSPVSRGGPQSSVSGGGPQSTVSRGGPQFPSSQISESGTPGRGRLQVLDNSRPALQPQTEDRGSLSTEFESTLSTFRQRNRG